MLTVRTLKKQLYLIPVYMVVLLYSCQVWEPMHLITPPYSSGFIDMTELIAPLLILIPVAFLFYNNYEIELSLVCGVSTVRLFFTKYVTVLLYALLPLYVMIWQYKYLPFVPDRKQRLLIPIVIPENYKVYMFISVTVTVLFFSALILFFRVLMKNCFTAVVAGAIVNSAFSSHNTTIRVGATDIRSSLYDLYLSNYFLGDEVPNMYKIDGMHNLWTYNRLLFFGLAVVLLVITYLLLRREKLHESFGE